MSVDAAGFHLVSGCLGGAETLWSSDGRMWGQVLSVVGVGGAGRHRSEEVRPLASV